MFPVAFAALLTVSIPPESIENPNRQPQLASSGNTVALVFGKNKSIMFSRSEDGGLTFSKPVKVTEMAALALGRHRGPRVAFSGGTIIVTAIGGNSASNGEHGAHGQGDLYAWRSTNGGRTWSKPVTVNDVPSSAREGLHSLAPRIGLLFTAALTNVRQQTMSLLDHQDVQVVGRPL